MILCSQCGSQLEEGRAYCLTCGVPVFPIQTPGPKTLTIEKKSEETGQSARANLLSKFIGGIAFVVTVVGLGHVTWMMISGSENITGSGVSNVNQNLIQSPLPAISQNTSPPAAMPTASAREEVTLALHAWANSLATHDLDLHMNCFASKLDIYHSSRSVDVNRVRSDLSRAFAKYFSLDAKIENIDISLDPLSANAVATFDKRWRFESRTGDVWTGSVRQKAWLKKFNQRWLITGLRDIQVYHTDK